jgi:hypothetical protein
VNFLLSLGSPAAVEQWPGPKQLADALLLASISGSNLSVSVYPAWEPRSALHRVFLLLAACLRDWVYLVVFKLLINAAFEFFFLRWICFIHSIVFIFHSSSSGLDPLSGVLALAPLVVVRPLLYLADGGVVAILWSSLRVDCCR